MTSTDLAFHNLKCERCGNTINLFIGGDDVEKIGKKMHNCGKGRHGIISMKRCNYYDILEIDPGCEVKDIKEAYRKMCLKYHPDINKSEYANEEFIQVMNAYTTLIDEGMRNDYDLELGDNIGGDIDMRMLEYIMKRDPRNMFIYSLYTQYIEWGHLTKRQREALRRTYISYRNRRFYD